MAVRRRCGVSNSHKIRKWAAYRKLRASALVGPGCYRISKAQPFRCCRSAAKENEPQGYDFLQHLSRCLVFFASSGCPVPLSAESRMSSQADCPQKVSDDSSSRRVFLESCAVAWRPNICTRASVFFLTNRSMSTIWRVAPWDFCCLTVPAVRYSDLPSVKFRSASGCAGKT